jgi:hypothetical protein
VEVMHQQTTVTPQIGGNRNTSLNRIALLAEVMIHDECRTLLQSAFFSRCWPKTGQCCLYDALVRKVNGEFRQTVFNDTYQQIRDINPQFGEFKNGAEFRELATCGATCSRPCRPISRLLVGIRPVRLF